MRTEIEFRILGADWAVPIVAATVNGDGPHDFVLDTGSTVTVVSRTLADALGIEGSGSSEAHTPLGPAPISTTTLRRIEVGEAFAEQIPAAIMDLSSVGEKMGIDLAGIVGYNFLKSFRLTLDYPNCRMILETASAGA